MMAWKRGSIPMVVVSLKPGLLVPVRRKLLTLGMKVTHSPGNPYNCETGNNR